MHAQMKHMQMMLDDHGGISQCCYKNSAEIYVIQLDKSHVYIILVATLMLVLIFL